jgi:hypothetical protein
MSKQLSETTYAEWLIKYKNGYFDNPNRETQCDAGWYDWFCKDEGLLNRLKKIAPKVVRIAKSKKIDLNKTYIFFKNNCPCVGKLYDDFRICDIETKKVIYTIIPCSGMEIDKGKAEVWGIENNFDGPIVYGTLKDIYSYFGV